VDFQERIILSKFDPLSFSEENFVQLSHGKVYYEYHNREEKGPLVVCMHGITWWSFCFRMLTEDLKQAGFRVILFDFYGRGLSNTPLVDYKPDLFVHQAIELLEKLEIKDKFFLLGLSMGGMIASHFTSKHPELVEKLILIGPAIAPVPLPLIARVLIWPGLGTFLFKLFGKNAMLNRLKEERFRLDISHSTQRTELVDRLLERVEWCILSKENFTEAFHSSLANLPFGKGSLEQLDVIRENNIPVLLIWGEKDQVCPFESHKMVLERLPQAKFFPVKEAFHTANYDDPITVHETIIHWLKEGDKSQDD